MAEQPPAYSYVPESSFPQVEQGYQAVPAQQNKPAAVQPAQSASPTPSEYAQAPPQYYPGQPAGVLQQPGYGYPYASSMQNTNVSSYRLYKSQWPSRSNCQCWYNIIASQVNVSLCIVFCGQIQASFPFLRVWGGGFTFFEGIVPDPWHCQVAAIAIKYYIIYPGCRWQSWHNSLHCQRQHWTLSQSQTTIWLCLLSTCSAVSSSLVSLLSYSAYR